jgi:membrane-bound ClpP family serine protease
MYLSVEEFTEKFGEAAVPAAQPLAEGVAVVDWEQGPAITQRNRVLELDGQRAEQLGLARYVVEDVRQLPQLYQLERTPELIGPNWAFELIDALASPQLAALLLFIGGFALIAELSSPGIGVGGFISALCFLLYFWSNFLAGTAELLEILLFLAGITFLLVELFILPGFGIFGVGGGALIIVSLVLASQTFVLPSNEYQFRQMPLSLLTATAAGAGVLTSFYVLRRYLHRAPMLGNVMLMPPDQDEADHLSHRESLVDYEHLMGCVGKTRTQLTPSGKAVFGDELVDVISDGTVIPKDTSVRVIEVAGNHLLVEPVDGVS